MPDRILSDYYDSFKCLAQSPTTDRDGGDSCNRHLTVVFFRLFLNMMDLKKAFETVVPIVDLYQSDEDRFCYVRHPDRSKWYSRLEYQSRDQSKPVYAVLGFLLPNKLHNLYIQHRKRAFFYWNVRRNGSTPENHDQVYKTKMVRLWYAPWKKVERNVKRNYNWKLPDISGFVTASFYIRGLSKEPGIRLLICDAVFVIEVLLKRYASKDQDVSNHILAGAFFLKKNPTYFSQLANALMDHDDLQQRMDKFYEPEYEIPMNVESRPVLAVMKTIKERFREKSIFF